MGLYFASNAWFTILGIAALGYSFVTHHLVQVEVLSLPKQLHREAKSVKWAIVTGSNTGIGFETARGLAKDYNYAVILACRNARKASAAVEAINAELNEDRAHFVELDLANFASVRSFVRELSAKNRKVEILVNNAGVAVSAGGPAPAEPTADGLGSLFQANFAGHFLLTTEMIEKDLFVHKAENDGRLPRIVNLSSVKHHFVDANSQQMSTAAFWKQVATGKSVLMTYNFSKLAAILFSVALNERYSNRLQAITANPGAVMSDIWRDRPEYIRRFYSLWFLTNQQGAHTSIAAAVGDFNTSSDHYLQPYWMPFDATRTTTFPMFEMLGPFQGHIEIAPRLHDNYRDQANSLWEAMKDLTSTSCAVEDENGKTTE